MAVVIPRDFAVQYDLVPRKSVVIPRGNCGIVFVLISGVVISRCTVLERHTSVLKLFDQMMKSSIQRLCVPSIKDSTNLKLTINT